MQNEEFLLKIIEKNIATSLAQKEIISSGLGIGSFFLQQYLHKFKSREEFKDYLLVKNTSQRNLGPGRYPTPPAPKVTAFTFNNTPRFKDDKISYMPLNKSTSKIKNFQKFPHINNAKSQKDLSQRIKKKKIQEIINKKAKEILLDSKKEKLITDIREKTLKYEYRKNSKLKDSICKTFTTLLIYIMIPKLFKKKNHHLKVYKKKIKKLQKFFFYLSKILGKFKILRIRSRLNISKKVFIKIMPKYIRLWKKNRKTKKVKILNQMVEKFCSISETSKILNQFSQRIIFLQQKFKSFLLILKTRRQSLIKYWNKLDKTSKNIPEAIKLYFINNYMRKQADDYYYANHLDKKVNVLLSKNDHEEIIEELFYHKSSITYLRLFQKILMIKVINSAHQSKRIWNVLVPNYKEPFQEPKIFQMPEIQRQMTKNSNSLKKARFATPIDNISQSTSQIVIRRKSIKHRTLPNQF